MAGMSLLVVGWVLSAGLTAAPAEPAVKVTPKETDEVLANPHMGWQTFHRFADEDKNFQGLPSSSAYFRLYWREVEPEEGKIDFAKLDGLLARARKAGQKLAFRIMCAGTDREYIYVPQWLKDKGCPGFEYQYQSSGPKHWVPDMDQEIFKKAHFRLIEELGKRYDGHADLDLVDIGTVGLWGEWHMSSTGVKLPRVETRIAIIDKWCEAFPGTPKVMLIGDEPGMIHAIRKGCGWRADCLGDMGGFSKTWNHMDNMYLQQIKKTDAGDAWKAAPVAFESCWDMRKWKQEGWDIPYIFDYALKCHVSYVNNKSAPIPEGTRADIERFLKKMGYRLVLRQLEHAPSASAGSSLSISMVWENVGVAPPYGDDNIAFRFTMADDREPTTTILTSTSVKGWLPGKKETQAALELPKTLKPGKHQLAIAIVDPHTLAPAVRLAITGRGADGWYPVSSFNVTAK